MKQSEIHTDSRVCMKGSYRRGIVRRRTPAKLVEEFDERGVPTRSSLVGCGSPFLVDAAGHYAIEESLDGRAAWFFARADELEADERVPQTGATNGKKIWIPDPVVDLDGLHPAAAN